MKQEVNGIELLRLLKSKNVTKIIRKKTNEEFEWNGSNIVFKYKGIYYTNIYNDITLINDIFIIDIEVNADELFEELGYLLKEENESYAEYQKKEYYIIMFNKVDKTYRKVHESEITIKENIAINKKMEELGWLQ